MSGRAYGFDSRQPHQKETPEVLYLQGFRGFAISQKTVLGIIAIFSLIEIQANLPPLSWPLIAFRKLSW